jgi:hypothetical protein
MLACPLCAVGDKRNELTTKSYLANGAIQPPMRKRVMTTMIAICIIP